MERTICEMCRQKKAMKGKIVCRKCVLHLLVQEMKRLNERIKRK